MKCHSKFDLNWNTAICKAEEELQVRRSKEGDWRSPKQAIWWNSSFLLRRRWTGYNLRYPESLSFRSGAGACRRHIVNSLELIYAAFNLRSIVADHGGWIRRRSLRRCKFLMSSSLWPDKLLLEMGCFCFCLSCCFCLWSCSCSWSHWLKRANKNWWRIWRWPRSKEEVFRKKKLYQTRKIN